MIEITSNQKEICMTKCPKFSQCNAPVCPLDPEWKKRKHFSEDKCCYYLLEAAKIDAKGRFKVAGLFEMYAAIQGVQDEIISSSASIKHTYNRAKNTPSRMIPVIKGQSNEV